jgi:hypothetical protein
MITRQFTKTVCCSEAVSMYAGNDDNEYTDEKFTIESGSGFTFSEAYHLFGEITRFAVKNPESENSPLALFV